MFSALQKQATERAAVASARVHLGRAAYALVERNAISKGDVLTTAQLAGIMGAKHTALLIPLCHNIFISKADVRLTLDPAAFAVNVAATVRTVGQTGAFLALILMILAWIFAYYAHVVVCLAPAVTNLLETLPVVSMASSCKWQGKVVLQEWRWKL